MATEDDDTIEEGGRILGVGTMITVENVVVGRTIAEESKQ
jgi:hypothetical protein